MDFFQAVILSIVEGLTEFLPISSTGHLILTVQILKLPQTEFVKSFEIIIQLGAILAIVFLYFNKLLKNTKLWPKLIIAFLPAAIVGLTLYKVIKDILLSNSLITVIALLVGGVLLIILEKIYKEKDYHVSSLDQISNKQAFLIGICQSISIIPGVSRAGATIIGGMFLGLKREVALEFSFLLAIPTIFAASGLDLIKSNFSFTTNEYLLLLTGMVGSFITALLVIKFFLKYVKTHSFIPFGIYRIILSIIFWLIIIK